ncbi:MAG: TolC family protein [Bacteroidota bacterium]
MKNHHAIHSKVFTISKKFRFLLMALIGLSFFNYGTSQELRIGVILDYEYNEVQYANVKENISQEVAKTVGGSVKLIIPDSHIIFTDYDHSRIIDAYDQLTKNCDVIVLIGSKSTKTILAKNVIDTPTIALGISTTSVGNIPLTARGTSGINNFSYILTSRTLEQELGQFYEVHQFKKLSLLFYQKAVDSSSISDLKAQLSALSNRFNCMVYPVPIANEITNSLKNIPKDSDAAFLGITQEMSNQGIEKIIAHLKSNNIPSYSPLKKYVEAGILMGISSDKDATAIYRKLGLMIDDIRNGINAQDLAVAIGQKTQLYFNMETSKAIGFAPGFQTLFTANLINTNEIFKPNTYSLADILQKTINVSLGIQVSYKDIDLTEREIKEAKSNYLPTLNLGLQASRINEEATNEFVGQSERSLNQTATVSQLIFSEPVLANIKIQKLLNEAQKYATKQEINNAIFQTFQLYLNILFAKSNVNIQQENLDVLKKNLELAELQSEIGSKNNSDVYRWKSEVANATQNLIEAKTALIISKASLNNFLNNTLEDEFDIEDVTLETDLFNYYEIYPLLGEAQNLKDIRKITQYLYQYAIENFPSAQQLEYSIKALERQKKSNNRAFYLPDITMGLSQSEVLQRGGVASEPTSELSNFIDSFWSVGVSVSYPLFEGNRKNIRRQQTTIQTEQLSLQKDELLNNLRLNIQNSVANLITGQTNILLSEESSENAQKNFEIARELYFESTISLIQFLDAQNASLSAKLSYINSIYNFVLAFAELENSIGFFSAMATLEEKEKFEKSINQFSNN